MSILKVGMYASQSTAANYLTFSSDAPFSISFTAKHWDGVLQYSLDAQNWYDWDASEINSSGNVLYLRGLGNSVITGVNDPTYRMTITSPSSSGVSCTGNIMTLLDHVSPETAVMAARCFSQMFRDNTNLTRAEIELPAMTLVGDCYRTMFYNCTSLTEAPELPATTLAEGCYRTMLQNCTGIKISSTKTGIYQKQWRIPTTGTISNNPTNWNLAMLSGTSGTFTGNPAINTTYYQAN
jgi:hypothetical protein